MRPKGSIVMLSDLHSMILELQDIVRDKENEELQLSDDIHEDVKKLFKKVYLTIRKLDSKFHDYYDCQ
jgi:hypothetical protein